jgi:hypothetical protein
MQRPGMNLYSRKVRNRWTRALSRWAGCAVCAALASVSSSARAATATHTAVLVDGNTVARLELGLPNERTFVLQGTVPVPRNTFPRPDGLVPFAIRDLDGSLVPAQVEIVTRYADDSFGADVVEVSARVTRPFEAPIGARQSYDIVYAPHARGSFTVDDSVSDLLRTGAIMLSSRDVFGNRYSLDLLEAGNQTSLRNGESIVEWRTHDSLMPDAPHGGADATLPHFLGVHAYFRVFDQEPIVELDLRIHNGHSGLDTTTSVDDPLGKVYFESLDLWLPGGWLVRDADPDVFTAGPEPVGGRTHYAIVHPLDNNALHVMPQQAQTIRRLVLYKPGDEDRASDYVRDANLGFARRGLNELGEELFSWWNPDTHRYFPQRNRLPELDHVGNAAIQAQLAADYATLALALRTGNAPGYPILAPALGWAHPYGVDDGGMQGGDGIVMFDGVPELECASNEGWRALAIRHRMYTDRHPVALYNQDGQTTDYTQWTLQGQSGTWLPIWCFLTPLLFAADPFGFTTAPTFQIDAVHAQHREPAYEGLLETYHPIDFEHFVRYTSPAKALVWIGNDSLAKDALFQQAALFRLSYNELPNSDYGHYISTGMGSDLNYVSAHPGIGFTFGRLESWGTDAVCAAYSCASPEWRQRVRPWFNRLIDLVRDGQAHCSGFVEAMVYEQMFLGHYRARQSIEQAIIENMLVSVRESVTRGVDNPRTAAINEVLRRSCNAMVTAPAWSDALHAPWVRLAVGDDDFSHPPFCGNTPGDGFEGGGDAYQCWSSFAYAFELTASPIYLQRATEMAGGGDLLTEMMAVGLDNIGNRAALLALLLRGP